MPAPLRQSVALVIEGPEGVLLVRRPDDDESLPGVWGLPAASLRPGESELDAVRRAGRDKLGLEVLPLRALGAERGRVADARLGGGGGVRRARAAGLGRRHAVLRLALGRPGGADAGGTGGLALRAGAAARARSRLGGVSAPRPAILARGPWAADQIEARWLEETFDPPADVDRAADAAVHHLRERGSPAHDGLATRLAAWREEHDRLLLELQPSRWALRLVEGNACDSLTALCVVRSADGRWLAGRRADWVSSWAGRWALGAGGAVDLGESPARTLSRELEEEWRLEPDRLSVEALVALPNGLAMVVGLATVSDGAEPVPDEEHDEWAWLPADVERWPAEADELRRVGRLLAAAT